MASPVVIPNIPKNTRNREESDEKHSMLERGKKCCKYSFMMINEQEVGGEISRSKAEMKTITLNTS